MSYSPVFETLKRLKSAGIYTEVTDLVVPVKGLGDNLDDARTLSRWIRDNLGPDTPLHFTRFHPDYKMRDVPVTPVETLERHYEIAKEEGLRFVYVGNILGHRLENTYCPNCGKKMIERYGFQIIRNDITSDGRCPLCGEDMHIIRNRTLKFPR